MKNNKDELLEKCDCSDDCACRDDEHNCKCDDSCGCEEHSACECDENCMCKLESNCCEDDLDQENEDIIIMEDEKGNKIEFQIIATYPIGDKNYIALLPLQKLEDVEENDIFIFRLIVNEDGEENIVPIETEEELEIAGKEFQAMCEEHSSCCCGEEH